MSHSSESDDVYTAYSVPEHVQLSRDGKPLTHKQKQNLKRKATKKELIEKKIKIQQQTFLRSSERDAEEELEDDELQQKPNSDIEDDPKHNSLRQHSQPDLVVEADTDSDTSDVESEPASPPNTTKKSKQKHRVEVTTYSISKTDDRDSSADEQKEYEDYEEEKDESENDEDEGRLSGEDQDKAVHETNAEIVDQDYAELRKELSNMPFGELQQLKEKIGIKLYNQVMFSQEPQSNQKRFKRENKNRPTEMSSKQKPQRIRKVLQVKKMLVRDPRFDDLSGEYKEDIFKSTYSFLADVKKNEKQKVLKQLTKEKDDEKKEQLEYLVRRMTAQEKAERSKEQLQQQERQRKKQERVLVSAGKQPFYLKQSDKKKLELAEKFRQLKKTGKVDTYLTKKRKKNAQKERRHLPTQLQ